MNDVLLTPEQEKFFSTYINKSKLLGLKQKIDLEFANAFRGFKDADNIAMPMLTNLPRYGKGTAEATTKSELFTRYEAIQSATLAKHSSHGKAVAACDKGKADLDRLIADIQKLQTKALQDSTPAPQRIILLKQDAHIKLVQSRAEFTAQSDVIKNKIEAAAPGVMVFLPVISEFNIGFEALRVRITQVAETGQTVDQATKTLATIAADAKTLVDAKLLALNGFSGSEALATLVADAKLQAAIQSQLSILNSNIGQMTTWEVPDAKGFAAEENILSKRINDSFYKATAKNKGEADAITLERTTILEEITALNARASQAIQAKKFAFGQLYRDVTARFETVERAFQNIDDTSFAKGQAAPIVQVLAVTRTAINDLNGYNTVALVAAGKLVDDAAVLVTDAQRIAEINRQINDDLGAIRLDIDFAISPKNPLNDRFVAHKKEYDPLAKDWRTMLVPDAVKAVKTFIETVK
ncbi:MAG: hypothetical protein U1E13_07300, partial [Methylophilaceae bacterium]|nr:hypothetical protein [Methylophilaceae bacterium]